MVANPSTGAGLPADDPAPWRAQLDALVDQGDFDGAVALTNEAIRRLRSNALVKGEPWTWLVRIHGTRGDQVELARALLTAGMHTHGEITGLWTQPWIALVPNEQVEAIRRRVEPGSRRYYSDMYNGKGVPPLLLRALGVPPQIDTLRLRELQGYGALCLAHFCAANAILDFSVSALVLHLVDLLVVDDWPEWEERLKSLDLSGLGAPLPPQLAILEPERLRRAFHRAVEHAVSIGVGDLYAASTEGPYLDCAILMETIERAGVAPPAVPSFLKSANLGSTHQDARNPVAHEALFKTCHDLLLDK